MNKVEMYLEKQNKIIQEDREKTLIKLGLTEKEYSPDNREIFQYPKFDYVNGEKQYYREVAITVTDEEYALILSKAKQVEEINAKKELERQKEQHKTSYHVIKKWIPVFEKPKDNGLFGEETEQIDNSKSKIAKTIRIYVWILAVLCIISSIIIAVSMETFWPVLIMAIFASLELTLLEAIASILDYFAELVSIARNGYKYTETTK